MSFRKRLSLSMLLFLGIVLTPIYLFSSGGLQVSHYVLACFIAGSIVTNRPSPVLEWDFALLIFVAYVWVRESLALLIGSPAITMISPLHITFTFLLYFYSCRHMSTRRDLVLVSYALSAACGVALISVLLTGYSLESSADIVRSTGSFNNPNQLGYFAICSASIICFLYNLKLIGFIQLLFTLVAAIFLSLTSLSKASMISMAFLLFAELGYVLLAGSSKAMRIVKVLSIILLTTLCVSVVDILELWHIFIPYESYSFVERLINFSSENDSNFGARGYGVILSATVIEFIFGISSYEAALRHGGHEVHSTIVSQVTYYGLLGSSFLLYFLWRWMRNVFSSHGLMAMLLVCAPVMLYGLTHNGIRFSLFWILIAISLSKAARPEST